MPGRNEDKPYNTFAAARSPRARSRGRRPRDRRPRVGPLPRRAFRAFATHPATCRPSARARSLALAPVASARRTPRRLGEGSRRIAAAPRPPPPPPPRASAVAAIEDKWIAGSVERCSGGAGVDALRDARVGAARARACPIAGGGAPLYGSRPARHRLARRRRPAARAVVNPPPRGRCRARTPRASSSSTASSRPRSAISPASRKPPSSARSPPDPRPADAAALGAVSDLRGVIADLNAALASDVVIIDLPAGLELANPVRVQLSTAGGDGHARVGARVRVSLGEGAKMTLVEEFAAAPGVAKDAAYWRWRVRDHAGVERR